VLAFNLEGTHMKNARMSHTAASSQAPKAPPKAKVFYGWWIVLAGTVVFVVSNGIGFYGHGVFLDPFQKQFGCSKGTISFAVTLYFLTTGIMGLFIGRPIDRYGPRPVMILGSIGVGFALMLVGRVERLWQLYAVYLLMAVGWSGTSLIPINTLVTNWFIRKRGLAMSVTMTGLSVGGMVMVPFATYLISRFGLKTALTVLGTLFWIVLIPIALFVLRRRPSDVGQVPDGEPAGDVSSRHGKGAPDVSYQMKEWTRRQAMGTLAFWSIVLAFFLAMAGQVAYLMHQVSFLSLTLGRSGAAMAVSATTAASIVGRLVLGVVVDRYPKRFVTMGLLLFQAFSVLALAYSNHVVVLYLGTFAFGLTMGSILMTQSLITGECFGLVSFATVSGAAGIFVSAGAAVGPSIAGFIYDFAGSYRWAFTVFAAMSLAAAFVVLLAKPPRCPPGSKEPRPV